jgi:hypothetical protein
MNHDTIDKFKIYFECLPASDLSQLEGFYSDDIEFADPVKKMKGLENIRANYRRFHDNLSEGGYRFKHQSILHDQAYLAWDLELCFKIPKKKVTVSGISVLMVTDKIIKHTNYYDAGALYYENLPMIGALIRMVKKQLSKY